MQNTEVLGIKQRFGIVGNSEKLNYAIRIAIQVAPTDMSVLITGESGSGKESFSKIIHQLSHRKHGQFIAVNCGAIPEGTIDSELFGHEKGAFTGAHDSRKGYFEVTNSGTIFLDEIGEMPMSTQARLLRVLENGEFIKVGSSKVLKTDVRVIAATNVNLLEAVKNGKFREDLYYRLSTVPINVPPVRDREKDIELLFKKFATDFAEKYVTKPVYLTPDAAKTLYSYSFPGNIRQLKNIVEQISILEINKEINASTLLKYVPRENTLPALSGNQPDNKDFSERDILYKVLFDLKGDVVELKKLVMSILNGDRSSSEMINDHKKLFDNISKEEDLMDYNTPPLLLEHTEDITTSSNTNSNSTDSVDQYSADDIQDIEHIADEEESLSIEDKEKELILKALKKNRNKRKYAAKDLGISERTLYRKLKQFKIDE